MRELSSYDPDNFNENPIASFKNLSQILFVASNKNLYELIVACLCLNPC